jgi:hypothetical protein
LREEKMRRLSVAIIRGPRKPGFQCGRGGLWQGSRRPGTIIWRQIAQNSELPKN